MQTVYMRFPQGRLKALSFGFYCGIEQNQRLAGLLASYGLPAAFFINALALTRAHADFAKTVKLLSEQDYEVAGALESQMLVQAGSLPAAAKEILASRALLEKITGRLANGLFCPAAAPLKEMRLIFKASGLAYACFGQNSLNFTLPRDFLFWQPSYGCGSKALEQAHSFRAAPSAGHAQLMQILCRANELQSEEDWRMFEKLCAYSAHAKEIWRAACHEIAAYCAAFKGLQFAADNSFVANPYSRSLWIELADGTIKELPGGRAIAL